MKEGYSSIKIGTKSQPKSQSPQLQLWPLSEVFVLTITVLFKVVSPPTALCLLRLFVNLKEGDVIVQNGATSAVGQSIIQLSRMKGIHTFNIIRDRSSIN